MDGTERWIDRRTTDNANLLSRRERKRWKEWRIVRKEQNKQEVRDSFSAAQRDARVDNDGELYY